MIRPVGSVVPSAPEQNEGANSHAPAASGDAGRSAYDLSFWLCYVSNAALTAAISLLFRYADFVSLLGGAEFELGWIVGTGMIGSLAMRWLLGEGIDRLGPRRVWIAAQALFAATVAAHVFVTTVHDPAVYFLRILYCIGIAGVFGSSITYVSRTVPAWRMAEVVGTLGTSGFIGMAIGPALGDWLSGAAAATDRAALDRMFLASAGLGVVALVAAAIATRKAVSPVVRRRPPTVWLLRRYHPGALLAVGAAVGFGLGLPGTFLRPYTASLGIEQIGLFFWVYTPTAFLARIASRGLTGDYGIRRIVLCGMGFLIAGVLAYLAVDREAMLVLPAVLLGVAHALLFPALMAAGAIAFPERHRGLATMLMLASMDVGTLLGAPLVGITLDAADYAGWPRYVTAFGVVALLVAAATVIYAREDRLEV